MAKIISKFDSVQHVDYVPRNSNIADRIKERAKIFNQLEKDALEAFKPKKKKNGKG